MLHIQCDGCHASAYVDCTCPPEIADLPVHMTGCPMLDPDAELSCHPGADCCDGSAHPDVSHGMAARLGHPNDLSGHPDPDHEGDHAVENDACAVCRPMTITIMPGTVQVQPAGRVG